jgi:hypothetical protein
VASSPLTTTSVWDAGFDAYLQKLVDAGNEGNPCTAVSSP